MHARAQRHRGVGTFGPCSPRECFDDELSDRGRAIEDSDLGCAGGIAELPGNYTPVARSGWGATTQAWSGGSPQQTGQPNKPGDSGITL